MGRRLLLLAAAAAAAAVAVAAVHVLGSGGVVRVRASTTTSLYATGLLDALARAFEEEHPGVKIDFIAVGSGAALRLAARGDVCLVLVHAPSLEKRYIEEGVIRDGRIFAYNYFAVAGPPGDPADVRDASSAVDAFRRIYRAGEEGRAKFVSRGDESGTNIRELMLWRMAGLDPRGRPWYIVSGQGMGATLVMADELGAYTLTDIGTYAKFRAAGRLRRLEILYTNSSELINVYSVYLVRGCGGEEERYARMFADFLVSPEGQRLIASYRAGGVQLFYPARGRLGVLREAWRMLARG